MRGGITVGTITEFKLGCKDGRETEAVRGASCTSRFDIDKITHIGWFIFMEEIASNRYDFVLYALFRLEPVKRFETRSDV